jgi:hypothetical protein
VASAPSYAGGTLGGIRADGAVFPLALSAELAQAHPVLASFGLIGSYEHVFDFKSTTPYGQTSGHASRWRVLLVGRVPLGHRARGGTLSIDTGFEQINWTSESATDIGVPDARHDVIDLGLGWDRTLGTRYLAFSLRLAYLAVLSSGPITDGTQYGSASAWGIETQGGLTAWPLRWLWLRLDAQYSRVALSFANTGARFAKTSADQWVGGALEVGFAL